jgi:hypothetical protein
MDREQISRILTVIDVAYPRFANDIKTNMKATIRLWHDMFIDFDENLVLVAVKQHIKTSVHPPTIADINDIIDKLLNPQLTELEAWNKVSRILGKCEPRKHYDLLPDMIREFMNYRDFIDVRRNDDESLSVISSNWQRSFRAFKERKRFDRMIGEDVRSVIDKAKELLSFSVASGRRY